jgi:UDPglucose--hexose-1-phosphate uridylyltransferase
VIDLNERAHRRFNPLRREWVLVSPQRAERPWQGEIASLETPAEVRYDPACYLCPGNLRHSGERNPAYCSTFVFDNDFPALLPDNKQERFECGGILAAEAESGICRVVCFSPDHSLSLARMAQPQIRASVDMLAGQFEELMSRPGIRHVQIFENRGEMMGCSNPHPHGQIWANQTVPDEVAKESAAMEQYRAARSTCLLCDYAALEEKLAERLVCENPSFLAVVPFWAVWPFEILLLARRHIESMDALDDPERDDLASMLKLIGTRYDRLFRVPFPYTMGFHQGHLHAHYYPPLLRSASVRKFMVGYEMLAMAQRDVTAESAAERLSQISD